jgi:hypothetical protein
VCIAEKSLALFRPEMVKIAESLIRRNNAEAFRDRLLCVLDFLATGRTGEVVKLDYDTFYRDPSQGCAQIADWSQIKGLKVKIMPFVSDALSLEVKYFVHVYINFYFFIYNLVIGILLDGCVPQSW